MLTREFLTAPDSGGTTAFKAMNGTHNTMCKLVTVRRFQGDELTLRQHIT